MSLVTPALAAPLENSKSGIVSPQYVPCPVYDGSHRYVNVGQTGPYAGGSGTHSQVYWVGSNRYEIVCNYTDYYYTNYFACACGDTHTSSSYAYRNHSQNF
ncbi:hypothetical protein D3C73_1507160 [compost metagenome]